MAICGLCFRGWDAACGILFFFILACMPVIVYVQREEDFFGPYFPAVTSGKTGEEGFFASSL